ncbi:hypothetical protein CVS40_1157 [Lucilia cuprina]|nr:hypothetical protein CVS40_1157 [Lucilia cuprina]
MIMLLDDVIADDESHWQHRVSSGFDRLVAFASTELDKTRRSIDTDTVPSSISCNTSPDSGITHSSSNSDAARTFLSTSSTSSQLDLPISSGSSTSSGNSSFMGHHGHHHNHLGGSQDHLSDSSMKSTHSDVNSLPITLKNCSSPQDPTAIDSPPLSDMGLPRTPSPNVAVNTPPPSLLNVNNNSLDTTGNNLKIPLKYQRKSKTSLEKHYKKKFCERNWEYDCDELLAYSNSSSNTAADAAGNANDQLEVAVKDMDCLNNSLEQQQQMQHHHHHQQQQQHAHHKSSKFRPKGKDWDWSMDSNSSSSQKTKCDASANAVTATPQSLQ